MLSRTSSNTPTNESLVPDVNTGSQDRKRRSTHTPKARPGKSARILIDDGFMTKLYDHPITFQGGEPCIGDIIILLDKRKMEIRSRCWIERNGTARLEVTLTPWMTTPP